MSGVLQGDFVLLRAGALRLLLPREEVGAAEYLETRPEPRPGEPLLLQPGDADGRPFAALSERMTLLPDCPADRFVVTTFTEDALGIGWCWDEMRVLIAAELRPQALPPALASAGSPVDGYVEHDGGIAWLAQAGRLAAFALDSGALP